MHLRVGPCDIHSRCPPGGLSIRGPFLRALMAAALAVLSLPSSVARAAPAPQPKGAVEIRFARRNPAAGYTESASNRPGEKLYLAAKPLFSNRDLTGARVASMGHGTGILLSFTPKAAKRLAAVTKKNRGRELALLLDGRVILVTTIGEPITGGEMALVADLSYADAIAVASALKKP